MKPRWMSHSLLVVPTHGAVLSPTIRHRPREHTASTCGVRLLALTCESRRSVGLAPAAHKGGCRCECLPEGIGA